MFESSTCLARFSAAIDVNRSFTPRWMRSIAGLMLVAALLAGCGLLGSRNAEREDSLPGEVTPTSRGVYTDDNYLHVHLESQDESGGSAAPNDHPVDIPAKRIKTWLNDLEVRTEDGGEPIALVPAERLSELSTILAQALGDAQPDEDVVFHVFRTAGSWFGSERRVTTARVFYRNGALNLIFGDLDDFFSEQIDRSLQPLRPGNRDSESELSGSVVDSPRVAFVDNRDDWIRLDAVPVIAAKALRPRAAVAAPAPVSVPAPVSQDPRWSQLEERLLILDGLRQKGLISQDDYETKKLELLEVLDLQ